MSKADSQVHKIIQLARGRKEHKSSAQLLHHMQNGLVLAETMSTSPQAGYTVWMGKFFKLTTLESLN